MSDRIGARGFGLGTVVRTAAIATAVAIAGCASRTPPPPSVPLSGDPPASRPAFVEAFRQAIRTMQPDGLERFLAFQDPLEEEFFRLSLPAESAGEELPRVDIVYARAVPPDRYFLCVHAPDGISRLLPQKDLVLLFPFRKDGDRWITTGFRTLRDVVASDELEVQDFMRWKIIERLADVRFGSAPPETWIDETRAQVEAIEVLSAPPYELVDPSDLEESKRSLARLTSLPARTPDALARTMAENLPPSFFNVRGYTLAFFLEAKEGETGIRLRPRDEKDPILVESLPILHDGAVVGAEMAPAGAASDPALATVTFALTPMGAEILRRVAEKRKGQPLVVVAGGEAIAATTIPAGVEDRKLAVGPIPEENAEILAKGGNAYAKSARAILEKLRLDEGE
ncbi:MAG: hypothetical protein JXP34_06510 [Planctomycetes bacterium]|nr:hypothetical protein [Planctomycetota bacterium]